MASHTSAVVTRTKSTGHILPLQNGDRLTRAEFERRYEAMPQLKKAELLAGVVYVVSPVSQDNHGGQHFDVITWLGAYRAATPGVQGGDNSTVRLEEDNEPQPDALLRITPECGGQSRTDKGGYVESAPELVAEVAASSASYDLHDKLECYRRYGVREYVIWRVYDTEVDWFILRRGRFKKLALNASGVIASEIFPGLWLDPAALVKGDMARVVQVLQQGLASAEHAAFVAKLQQAASRR